MQDLWLISKGTIQEARKIARGLGLTVHQWRYIPWDQPAREEALKPYFRDFGDRLIGYFSAEERVYL